MSQRRIFLAVGAVAIAAVVQFFYIGYIEPAAQMVIDQAKAAGETTPQTLAVILKDGEQKLCIIFALICAMLIIERSYRTWDDRYLFDVDLFKPTEGAAERPSLEQLESLDEHIRETPLVKTMLASIRRFDATKSVQNAADVIDTNIEATGMKMESGNAWIKYLIWAIPSIGFVGTVRGIGAALAEADKALNGDLASVTELLGVAFNSTLVALILSILLTFGLYILQKQQDETILSIADYCDRFLVKRLTVEHSVGAQ